MELTGPAEQVAPALLGAVVVHGDVAVRLTEVEAYAGEADPGSHAFRGRTPRSEVMFGPAGVAYVYFSYGMHWCMNVVTGPDGTASAVLLRAGEVVQGVDVARERRGGARDRDLARGPARLTKALGVTGELGGTDLLDPASPLRLVPGCSGRPGRRPDRPARRGVRRGRADPLALLGRRRADRVAVPSGRRAASRVSGRLQGRIGVVSGGGRGLGAAVAEALAAEGMSLLLLARTGSEVRGVGERLAEQHGVSVLPAAIDVADPAAVERVVLHAEQQLGPVDVLVNAAARIEPAEQLFWEADPEQLWSVVETNLRGPLLLTRALLPAMVQRGHGHVVGIASRARAATETGTYTGYAVSKRALSLLTQSLAGPLAGTGVVALDVLPGLVRTALTDSMPVWRDRTDLVWDPPEATASVVVDVALGRYDDRAGQVLDAPALFRD